MIKYIIQRIIAAFFTFLVIVVVVFFVIHSMPGDIIDLSSKIDPTVREVILDKYHLNDPLIVQFGYTMADYLHFDFGYSLKIRPGVPVLQVVLERLPITIQLNYFAALLILPVGLILGIIMAIKKDTVFDHISSSLVILLISVPSFVLAALMQYFLAYKLGWFPIILEAEESLTWSKF